MIKKQTIIIINNDDSDSNDDHNDDNDKQNKIVLYLYRCDCWMKRTKWMKPRQLK